MKRRASSPPSLPSPLPPYLAARPPHLDVAAVGVPPGIQDVYPLVEAGRGQDSACERREGGREGEKEGKREGGSVHCDHGKRGAHGQQGKTNQKGEKEEGGRIGGSEGGGEKRTFNRMPVEGGDLVRVVSVG